MLSVTRILSEAKNNDTEVSCSGFMTKKNKNTSKKRLDEVFS